MSSSSSSYKKLAHLQIPLQEILSATDNFSDANLIRETAFKKAYKGQLEQIDIVAERLCERDGDKNDMFWSEISMLSSFKHENVVSVFGFCDEKDEKIIIYKFKAEGSLHTFLSDPALTWVKRLEICNGVVDAIFYLLSMRLIHGNMSSCNILLDDNWKPYLFGFEHSVKLSKDQYTGSLHQDPTHEKTVNVSHRQSDVYSFGVVLFEVMCGRDDDLLGPLANFDYEAGKLHDLVHPGLFEQMDPKSFKIFSETAFECLKEKPSEQHLFHQLMRALDLQMKHEYTTKNSELLKIGFKDIESATEKFSERNIIGSGGFGTVYKAVLKHSDNRISMALHEGMRMIDLPRTQSFVAIKCITDNGGGEEGFSAEIEILESCRHRNIVSLLGFCDEDSQKILVYEYVSRGSLDKYLEKTNKMKKFKWEQRLQMCLDISQGLNYLHTKKKIIHRDIKSANILFDDSWVAKIADFGLSKTGPTNQVSYLKTLVAGTIVYLDPDYEKTNKLRKASDIYSLGVVLFEIMSGTLAYDMKYTKENSRGLAPFIRQQYVHKGQKETIKVMLDPNLNEEIDENFFTPSKGPNQDSVDIFFSIAYKCLAETQTQRPNIATIVDKLKEAIDSQNKGKSKQQISLGAIKSATDNFNKENGFRRGRFGRFYKGKATNGDGSYTDIAVQRLDKVGPGRKTEFWRELEILQKYRHENVIGVLGYCDESDEKIIVYDYASRGSLDRYLNDNGLTWKQRLQICIDVASGLNFLQGGGLGEEFLIHGDIRSSKILLTQDWKPKLCDFGFSVLTNQKNTEFLTDKDRRTKGFYEDQAYKTFGLTKESDIFAFGILLVEIYSGKLYNYLYKSYFPRAFIGIKEQIAPKSLTTFKKLISDCNKDELPRRPTIDDVLLRIKQALESQMDYEIWTPKLPNDYEQIFKMSNSLKDYKTENIEFLYNMLLKGILLQEGKMLFTLGNNGERNLMVSAKTFSYINGSLRRWRYIPESRFQETAMMLDILNLKIEIKTRTQFLSPNVNYGVYLVFKFIEPKVISSKRFYVNLKYKDGSKISNAYFATWRDNEWMTIELVQFLNDTKDKYFEFLLESFSQWNCGDGIIYIEGIEFRPITHMKDDETNKSNKAQQILKSDLDVDLLQHFPTNYQEIVMRIGNDDSGEELYWLREVNGDKHLMLSAKAALDNYDDMKLFKTTPSTQSRFPEVIELLPQQVFDINCAIKSLMLSRDIDYVCYLVFRLSEKCHGLHSPIKVRELLHSTDKETEILYFRSPSPWNLHDTDQTPEQRDDGWMEVRVWKFNISHEFEDDYLRMNLRLISFEGTMSGLIVYGIEFRPM